MQHKLFKALLVFAICSLVISSLPVSLVRAVGPIVVVPPGVDTAAENDFTVLQDALTTAQSGDTIDISGTFDWSDAHPAAHAAYLDSFNKSSSSDIRGLQIPTGLDDLTITSTLQDATIIGASDVADMDGNGDSIIIFSTFIYTQDAIDKVTTGNANLTVENLSLDNFEGAVTLGWNNGVFPGTMLRNNQVTLAGDDGDKNDWMQNVAFYFGPGANQTITGNTVTFMANGTRTEGYFGPKNGASFGFQNSTTGADAYNGLTISDNTFKVDAASNGLEETYGIWENSHSDVAGVDIHLTGNSFLGRAGDLFDHAFLLSSQTGGLDISGNTLTGVDEVLSATKSQGYADGDRFNFKGNTLSNVGGADGIFMQNVTNDTTPVHVIVNWDVSNTIDGETGVRGLNELSSQATHSARPNGAATDLSLVYGVPAPATVNVDDDWASTPRFADGDGLGVGLSTALGYNGYSLVTPAIQAVANPGAVNVLAGNYVESGQMVVDKSVTVTGHTTDDTFLRPADNTATDGDARAWILVKPGATFNLSNFTLDGNGKQITRAIMSYGSGVITHNLFQNIQAAGDEGIGVTIYHSMTVSSNRFANIGRVGILTSGSEVTAAVIANNIYTGKGDGVWLDYGIEIGAGAHATVTGNVVTNNTGVVNANDYSAGIYVHTYFGPGTTATITSNTLVDNLVGIQVGYVAEETPDASTVTASFNRFFHNNRGIATTVPTVQAANNWWSCNLGPANSNCDPVSGDVVVAPWLVLTAQPDFSIMHLGTTAFTANLNVNSAGETNTGPDYVPTDTVASFETDTYGVADTVPSVNPASVNAVSGVFATTYTAPAVPAGTPLQVCAEVDNQAACSTVTLQNIAPVAVADSYTTLANQAIMTTASTGVLSNDTDADHDTLTAVVNVQPTNGTLTLNADGSFTYTPKSGFNGTDSFTYHANDGTADSNIVTVTINVGKLFIYLPMISR